MRELETRTKYYELTSLQQKILFAEKHKKNYGIYFSVRYDSKWSAVEVERSIEYVMNATEAFNGRIMRQGAQYVFAVDREVKRFRSHEALRDKRIQIFDEGLLASYYIEEEEHCIQFLMHHLIMDGDSLYLFLDCLEKVLIPSDPLLSMEGSYFQQNVPHIQPTRSSSRYTEEIKRLLATGRDSPPLNEPEYGGGRLSVEAYNAVGSLAGKLRVTRFGVILLATGLLSRQRQSLIGVVVSRKNHRDQKEVIGNFTDLVPFLLKIDESKSYIENALILFKELFAAIEHSATLSYEEYMDLLGLRGYDYVLSYTKMIDLERKSVVFSHLELGEYLYKYNNHLQFNEHEDQIAWETCYDQPATQRLAESLEETLLELDNTDLCNLIGAGSSTAVYTNECAVVSEAQVQDRWIGGDWFPDLDENESLFDSSLSSLDVARMITDIYENLGVQLSYQDIYASGTIRELRQLILSRVGYNKPLEYERDEQLQYQCPNFMKVIFIDSFRFVASKMYEVKYAYRLTDNVVTRLERFKESIEQVILNNDVFFTDYVYEGGKVIGTIQRDRHAEIERISVNDLDELYQMNGNFRFQGGQKLWDIQLVSVLSTGTTYLYINMHHMLIDHVGIGILLSQITNQFNSSPIDYAQYVQIADNYDAVRVEDLQGWQPLFRYQAYPNQGKPCLSKGGYHLHKIAFQAEEAPYHEMELRLISSITDSLAQLFDNTKGYIGAVYHGRVVPNATKVIHSFARVLPIFFDTMDDQVLQESLHTAHRHQAVSIYDLNEAGLSLEFPKVVFQTLVADSGESTLFDQTIEFEGVSKFQILFNLQIQADGCLLSIYIDDQMYDLSEEEWLVELVTKAVQSRQRIGDEISELTSLQRKMFICNKLPIYRLPLLYPLEPEFSYTAVETALYETIKAQPTLQVKYSYEPQQRRFYQRYVPLQPEDLIIGREETLEEPKFYIERKPAGIDLSKDYPWRVSFLEWSDKRYLYIEFHHIAIDGLGIRIFEEALFNRLLNHRNFSLTGGQPLSLSTYRRICELQPALNVAHEPLPELLKLPVTQNVPAQNVGRLTLPIDQDCKAAIERTAKQLGVTKNAVFQGLLEEVLSHSCTGQAYGTIGNWRMRLGNFGEVGCYVRIHPKLLKEESDLEGRIRNIFTDNLKSLFSHEDDPAEHREYPVMYSYEEDLFRYFQYIPADRLCKFDIYFRVYCHNHATGFEVEYSRNKYTDDQVMKIINSFRSMIESTIE